MSDSMVKASLNLIRPQHWLKNALVLLPLVFSGKLLNTSALVKTLIAALAFCFASSLVYVVNDLIDVDADRLHPTKRMRPIASGAISSTAAIAIALCLAMAATVANYFSSTGMVGLALVAIYIIMNLAYSVILKRLPIVDVTIIAFGFLLRVVYGAFACNVGVSGWLYLTVLSGSFYLALGKRRGEMDMVGVNSRKALRGYSRAFLDRNMYMFLGLTITFYALWARESGARLWTVPLVMVIFMRYSLDAETGSDGDPMGVVMHDRALLLLIGVYLLAVFAIIYLQRMIT